MAEGRLKAAWGQTSTIVAFIHNNNPHNKRSITPDEVNPFISGIVARGVKAKIADLGKRFSKKHSGGDFGGREAGG